jgi:hypothetical protein
LTFFLIIKREVDIRWFPSHVQTYSIMLKIWFNQIS